MSDRRREEERRSGDPDREEREERAGVRGGYAAPVVLPARVGIGALTAAEAGGGFWAGIFTGLLAMVVAAVTGRDVFTPLRLVGAAVYGAPSAQGPAPIL
ncbi:MAG: hypothetical protein HY321_02405 [Armatimonadetes bacterium]|nr:hypothetical protein [Armatimonadota bacterium]